MQDKQGAHLRIYCICGQKMKVSDAMLGRPGKCVACRQKLRVPSADEIPEGAAEIRLQDHPEFLRRTYIAPPVGEESAAATAVSVETEEYPFLDTEGTPRRQPIYALDVLQPLREIVSIEYRIAHKQSVLKSGGTSHHRPEHLEKYLTRVHQVHEELDEMLRERLRETVVDLDEVREKLDAWGMKARLGEVDFARYREKVAGLRLRRDILERRQTNLRGWLAVDSPYEAGGYQRLSVRTVPDLPERIAWGEEPDDSQVAHQWAINRLTRARVAQEQAERRLYELDRVAEGAPVPTDLEFRRSEAQSTVERAKANARFWTTRLEAAHQDLAADLAALQAQRELLQARREAGAVSAADADKLRQALDREEMAIRRESDVVAKALSEKHTPAAILRRPAADGPQRHAKPLPNADLWLLGAAALLLVVSLLLPAVGALSPLAALRELNGQAPVALWLAIVPTAGALALTGVAFIRRRSFRGIGALLLFLVMGGAALIFFHETARRLGPAGDHIREYGLPLLRPGVALYTLALALTLAAAAVTLLPVRGGKRLIVCALAVAAVGAVLIMTDVGGLFRPDVSVEASMPATGAANAEGADWNHQFTLRNDGRRAAVLFPSNAMPNGVDVVVERRTPADGWQPVAGPARVETPETGVALAGMAARPVLLGAGEEATLYFQLDHAGQHRLRLNGRTVETFAVDAPAPTQMAAASPSNPRPPRPEPVPEPAAPAPAPTEDTAPVAGPPETPEPPEQEPAPEANDPLPEANATPDEPAESPAQTEEAAPPPVDPNPPAATADTSDTEVELKGIIAAGERPPRFSIGLYLPDGRAYLRTLNLGADLHNGWVVAEFNPDGTTVTLRRGEDLLILRRGERYELP